MSKRLLALVALSICFILFQNMSPLDESKTEDESSLLGTDIREWAPRIDHGDTLASYFPTQAPAARSPAAVADSILTHNFADQLRGLESQFGNRFINLRNGELFAIESDSENRTSSTQATTGPRSGSNLKIAVPDHHSLRLSYTQGITLRCDYDPSLVGMNLQLNKSWSPRSELTLAHQTERQQSSLNFNYHW